MTAESQSIRYDRGVGYAANAWPVTIGSAVLDRTFVKEIYDLMARPSYSGNVRVESVTLTDGTTLNIEDMREIISMIIKKNDELLAQGIHVMSLSHTTSNCPPLYV